jgi:hypothetical protein
MFMIAAYMEAVARDRAADRGCTGGGKVAGRHGPAESNSGRVFFFIAMRSGAPPGSRPRQGGLFKSEIGLRYRGTAAVNLRSASRD